METINANAAFLCNYEVMQILQKLKDNTQRKHKREASLATVTYETVHYLQNTECKNQSEESIRKCLEAMKCFKLTKSEKLMMLNTPPRTELEIQLIVQESEERLSEEEVKKIIAIVNEFLPASTYLLDKKILLTIRNTWLLAHGSSNNTTEFNKTMLKVSHLSRLLLYKRDASPPSCAVMMLGDILGLQFDYKEPDLGQLEHHSLEFKKISPMSTIPVLQDGDLTICESHAILKYLIRKYGGEKREMLYPSDLQTRAIIDQLMFYDAGVFFARLKSIALPTLQQGLSRASERHVAYIEETSSVLEAHLKNHSYIAADHLTVADLSVGTTTMAMQSLHKLDGNRFPLSTQWLTRLKEEECFKKNYDFSLSALSKMLNINK